MVAISVRSLTKAFDCGILAVDGVDLEVASGEFLVLLGPTGCGKSTLLRLIAGFERPTAGAVLFDGVVVTDLQPADRDVAMVFQNYALYPHLTVAQNIGFPLRSGGDPVSDVPARIAEAARDLGLTDLLNRLPAHLSGGQRQRVAMARAIVRRPSVLLLDEPMSNVDAGVRAELRGEIVAMSRRLGVTTIYVTHDQAEAMSMADRVAVLRRGRIEQVGPPAEVYADPQTLFVAGFLGTPRPSLLEAALHVEGDTVLLDLGGQVLRLPRSDELVRHHTERVTVALRALSVGTSDLQLTGVVRAVANQGHEVLARVDIGGVPTPQASTRQELPERPAPSGPSTGYGFYPQYEAGTGEPAGEVYARIPAPTAVTVGDEVTLGLSMAEILLFGRGGRRIAFIER
jgi:multiple sugar transport system ATP-binding protein